MFRPRVKHGLPGEESYSRAGPKGAAFRASTSLGADPFVTNAVWQQEIRAFMGQSKRKTSLGNGRFSHQTWQLKDSELLELTYLLQSVQIIIIIYSDIQARLKALLRSTARCPSQLHRTHILLHIILLLLPQAPKIAEGKFLWLKSEEKFAKELENQQRINEPTCALLCFHDKGPKPQCSPTQIFWISWQWHLKGQCVLSFYHC